MLRAQPKPYSNRIELTQFGQEANKIFFYRMHQEKFLNPSYHLRMRSKDFPTINLSHQQYLEDLTEDVDNQRFLLDIGSIHKNIIEYNTEFEIEGYEYFSSLILPYGKQNTELLSQLFKNSFDWELKEFPMFKRLSDQ